MFFHLNGDQTQEMLESTKTSLQKEMETLKEEAKVIERTLSELKVQLYAKFGTNINLESNWLRELEQLSYIHVYIISYKFSSNKVMTTSF